LTIKPTCGPIVVEVDRMAKFSTVPVLFPTPFAVLAKVLAAKASGAPKTELAALDAAFKVAVLLTAKSPALKEAA
jgi:hypothetical protein